MVIQAQALTHGRSFGVSSSFVEAWGVPTSPSQQDSSNLALPSCKEAITLGPRWQPPFISKRAFPTSGSPWDASSLWAGGAGVGTPVPACPHPALGQCWLLLIAASASLIFIVAVPALHHPPGLHLPGGERFLLLLQRSSWIPQKPSP